MLQTAACSRLRKRVNPLVFTRRYEHLRNRISYAEIYKIWDIKYIREKERNSWVKTLSWQTRERRSNDESKISSILDRTSCAHEHTLFLDRNSREYRITILWQCRWFTTCVTLNFQHASHTLCSFTQQIAPCIERLVSTSNNRDQSDHRSCTPISAYFRSHNRECEHFIFQAQRVWRKISKILSIFVATVK